MSKNFLESIFVPQTKLLHHINTLMKELNRTKAYEESSTDEKTVGNSYLNELPLKCSLMSPK